MISLLGRLARAARQAGLGPALRWGVALVDATLIRLRRAPLRAVIDGVTVRGFLRHRSFLAEARRPRETYAELFVSLLRPDMTVLDVRTAENVEIVPLALSDAEGVTTFYETRSTIGSSLIERADAKAHRVETTSVDALLAGRDVSSLLVKLNIEGAEHLAVRGMRETLVRVDSVAILIEVNPPLLAAGGTDVDAMLDALRSQGFAVSYVDLPTQTPVPLPEPLRKGHLLVSRNAGR